MADVYGPEFNFSTEEIINIIRKISKLKVGEQEINHIEAETAVYNCDYYVRPGSTKKQFISECKKIVEAINLRSGTMDDGLNLYLFVRQMVDLVQKFFDEAYFEEQIERRKSSTTITANKDKLRMYLKKLDRYKLAIFFYMVLTCRLESGLFVTELSSRGFWKKIYEAGVNVPEVLVGAQGQWLLNNNMNNYINTLSTKVFANMLCDAIDLDIETASSAAKKLYTSGRDAMINYIRCKTGIELQL